LWPFASLEKSGAVEQVTGNQGLTRVGYMTDFEPDPSYIPLSAQFSSPTAERQLPWRLLAQLLDHAALREVFDQRRSACGEVL
jgi:hypothetical protein